MLKWGALLAIAGLLLAPTMTSADDAAVKAQIEAASDGMNQAFQRKDWDYVKANITQDHLSVFPAWGKPTTFAEDLKLLPDLTMKQTILSGPTITLLGPDAAMRTSIVKLEGDYKGEPLP